MTKSIYLLLVATVSIPMASRPIPIVPMDSIPLDSIDHEVETPQPVKPDYIVMDDTVDSEDMNENDLSIQKPTFIQKTGAFLIHPITLGTGLIASIGIGIALQHRLNTVNNKIKILEKKQPNPQSIDINELKEKLDAIINNQNNAPYPNSGNDTNPTQVIHHITQLDQKLNTFIQTQSNGNANNLSNHNIINELASIKSQFNELNAQINRMRSFSTISTENNSPNNSIPNSRASTPFNNPSIDEEKFSGSSSNSNGSSIPIAPPMNEPAIIGDSSSIPIPPPPPPGGYSNSKPTINITHKAIKGSPPKNENAFNVNDIKNFKFKKREANLSSDEKSNGSLIPEFKRLQLKPSPTKLVLNVNQSTNQPQNPIVGNINNVNDTSSKPIPSIIIQPISSYGNGSFPNFPPSAPTTPKNGIGGNTTPKKAFTPLKINTYESSNTINSIIHGDANGETTNAKPILNLNINIDADHVLIPPPPRPLTPPPAPLLTNPPSHNLTNSAARKSLFDDIKARNTQLNHVDVETLKEEKKNHKRKESTPSPSQISEELSTTIKNHLDGKFKKAHPEDDGENSGNEDDWD
jgi:hypothetical protein